MALQVAAESLVAQADNPRGVWITTRTWEFAHYFPAVPWGRRLPRSAVSPCGVSLRRGNGLGVHAYRPVLTACPRCSRRFYAKVGSA